MTQSSKPKGNLRNRLMRFLILNLVFYLVIFLPLISEAAYKVYLKNGRILSGVTKINEETNNLKIYRGGIILELPKTSVIKIEEYHKDKYLKIDVIPQKSIKEETPAKEELPEYLEYKKTPVDGEQEKNVRRLTYLKRQHTLILDRLKRIEALENLSKELEMNIRKAKRKGLTRKARLYREEKESVDKKLEALIIGEESLLKQKKELEEQIIELKKRL